MSLYRRRLSLLLALALLILSACNLPRESTPTQSGLSLLNTAAAATVNAQLTLANLPPGTAFNAATFTPPGTFPHSTPLPTTPVPAASTPVTTGTSLPCDRAEFVSDVNFPDNSTIKPGESFVKTWRLRNAGSCTWTTAYNVVFTGGDAMGAPAASPLSGSVSPGNTTDISVTLTAPEEGGTHRAEFKLRNASNVIFGMDKDNDPFWVQIKVPGATGVLFDFLANADVATWTSGVGSEPGSTITFDGDAGDPNGAARLMDQVRLETGAFSGKLLLMFPRHDDRGYVSGLFPAYKVQQGDHLRARIGFMIPSGDSCGSARALFQVYYKEGDGELKLLDDWTKTCNQSLLPIDIDLSSLSGREVRFAFSVGADGSFTGDWAIWNSPRIEH
jgi:hypothetical protein